MLRFDGHILGSSFDSGHRLVIGRWVDSPFGGFTDLMWRRPDGTRVLCASDDKALAFIAGHYAFEERHVQPVAVERAGERLHVRTGDIDLSLALRPPGVASHLLRSQPRILLQRRAWITGMDLLVRPWLAPLLLGPGSVRLAGRTLRGAREWYAISDFRHASANATVAGEDLGPVGPCPPARFGFSEFPAGAGLARVTSLFEGSR